MKNKDQISTTTLDEVEKEIDEFIKRTEIAYFQIDDNSNKKKMESTYKKHVSEYYVIMEMSLNVGKNYDALIQRIMDFCKPYENSSAKAKKRVLWVSGFLLCLSFTNLRIDIESFFPTTLTIPLYGLSLDELNFVFLLIILASHCQICWCRYVLFSPKKFLSRSTLEKLFENFCKLMQARDLLSKYHASVFQNKSRFDLYDPGEKVLIFSQQISGENRINFIEKNFMNIMIFISTSAAVFVNNELYPHIFSENLIVWAFVFLAIIYFSAYVSCSNRMRLTLKKFLKKSIQDA